MEVALGGIQGWGGWIEPRMGVGLAQATELALGGPLGLVPAKL